MMLRIGCHYQEGQSKMCNKCEYTDWVSIDKDKPNEEQLVLGYFGNWNYRVIAYSFETAKNMTHWRPLPLPPKD